MPGIFIGPLLPPPPHPLAVVAVVVPPPPVVVVVVPPPHPPAVVVAGGGGAPPPPPPPPPPPVIVGPIIPLGAFPPAIVVHPILLGVPFVQRLFTGAYPYDPRRTITWDADRYGVPQTAQHGVLQDAGLGAGVPIDANCIAYSCNGHFDPGWIAPVSRLLDANGVPRSCYRRAHKSHHCIICGWDMQEAHLVYPLGPIRLPAANLMQPFGHFCCFASGMHNYPHCRYQAIRALVPPIQIRWSVSANNGWQSGGHLGLNFTRWTLLEMLDLIVGMKLAGYLPVWAHGPYPTSFPGVVFDWKRILRFCAILRLTGKSLAPHNQLQRKWQLECGHAHLYFNAAFFALNMPIVNSRLPPLP